MSTTWKSLAVGFAAGGVTVAAFFLHLIIVGVILALASLGYIRYQYLEAEHIL